MKYSIIRFVSPIVWMVACLLMFAVTEVTVHRLIVTPISASLTFQESRQFLIFFVAYSCPLAALILAVAHFFSSRHGEVYCNEEEFWGRFFLHAFTFLVSYLTALGLIHGIRYLY